MASTVVRRKLEGQAQGRGSIDRSAALRAADASLRLEGMHVSSAVKELGEQWARGDLSATDLMRLTKAQALAEIER